MTTNALPFQEINVWEYLRWNAFVSEHHKLLYVATPKVACTSLKWWFADLEGVADQLRATTESSESAPDLVIHDSFQKVAPAVTGLPPSLLADALLSNQYFRFAVVRNPYKRVFSAWQSKLLLREPLQVTPYLHCEFFDREIETADDIAAAFEGFLEHIAAYEAPNFLDIHWTPQIDVLRPDLIPYTLIAKIENAAQLSSALAKHLGPGIADPVAGQRTNESLIPFRPEFITPRSAALIRSLYSRDFETFGYDLAIPSAREEFSALQLGVAIQAIQLIRGRHQRLSETRRTLEENYQEYDKAKTWLVGQRDAWEAKAKANEQQLGLLTNQIDELRRSSTDLVAQRAVWEEAAKTCDEKLRSVELELTKVVSDKVSLTAQVSALEDKVAAANHYKSQVEQTFGSGLLRTLTWLRIIRRP